MTCGRRIGVAVCIFFISPLVIAQVDDSIVVTATRVPTRFKDLVNDVSVITREELDRAGQNSLATVLQRLPGVEVTQAGGPGGTTQIFIRGTNAGHALVIIDGMRVGSASTGLTPLEHIPLEQIDRIEVLRGAASSLYGSDAIGGVIQVFTRSGRGDPGVNASAGVGSYGTFKLGAGYGFEKEGNRFSIQAGATTSSGITAVRNPSSSSFNPDADGYRNTNVTAQYAKIVSPGNELGVRAFHSAGVKHFDATPRTFDHRLTESLTTVSAFARNQVTEAWRSNLTVGTGTDDLTSIQSAVTQDVFRTIQNQVAWQNDFRTSLGLFLGSLEYLSEHVSGTTALPVRGRTVTSFLSGYQNSIGAHQLQASFRHDHNTQFGSYNTWQAGYGYKFTPVLRAWVNAGTGYKAPTFNQLYFPGFGNAGLRPEKSEGTEVGAQYTPDTIQYGVVYYRNKITDLIINAGVPLAPFNVAKADIKGVTLSAKGQLRSATVTASLDIQDPEDAVSHKMLPRRAKNHASLSGSVPAYGGWFTGEVIASSARYDDTANAFRLGGYVVANISYEMLATKRLKIFARIDNIGDKRYELVRDFNVQGRTIFVGARFEEKGF